MKHLTLLNFSFGLVFVIGCEQHFPLKQSDNLPLSHTLQVVQWGTKGLQCCTLLGLLAYISRNKIEQILKIFEVMNVFLSFNMI
jgi:hypothetical protein